MFNVKQVLSIDTVLPQTRCPACSCRCLVRLSCEALVLSCSRCGHTQEALVVFSPDDDQKVEALVFT